MVITLTPREFAHAGIEAIFRHTVGANRNDRSVYGESRTHEASIGRFFIGCVAELAVSKGLNEHWHIDGRLCPPDIGADIEVRATEHRDGCLIVYEHNPDAAKFYLVVIDGMCANIVGWIYGRDAKRTDYWKDDARYPAYFVPQNKLTPV